MRRGRIFFLLAFILILGLAAVLVVYQRVIAPAQRVAENPPTPTVPPIRIMVAANYLTKGTVLSEDKLSAVPWPPDKILPGMFVEASKNEVIRRQLRVDVDALMPIMAGYLVDEGEQVQLDGSPWALSIPPGQVAVSIPVGKLNAVSYAPRPGDHVDVIATISFYDVDTDYQTPLPNSVGLVIASGPPDPVAGINLPLTVNISPAILGRTEIDPVLGQAVYVVPSGSQRPRLVSQMVVQDAMILGMGVFPLMESQAQPTPVPGQPTPTPQPEAAKPEPVVLTLILRPQDAVTLNYLMFSGAQLTLALRGVNDTSRFSISPVTLQFLLDQYQIPVPVRLPYSINPLVPEFHTITISTPPPK